MLVIKLADLHIKTVQNTRFIETRGRYYSEAMIGTGKKAMFLESGNGDTKAQSEQYLQSKIKLLIREGKIDVR